MSAVREAGFAGRGMVRYFDDGALMVVYTPRFTDEPVVLNIEAPDVTAFTDALADALDGDAPTELDGMTPAAAAFAGAGVGLMLGQLFARWLLRVRSGAAAQEEEGAEGQAGAFMTGKLTEVRGEAGYGDRKAWCRVGVYPGTRGVRIEIETNKGRR